jgi:serine/threonine protein phosphatase PrpC
MLDLTLERGGLDNVTVVVVRLSSAVRSSEPTKSPVADGRPEWRS